jgi:hypothetical protein
VHVAARTAASDAPRAAHVDDRLGDGSRCAAGGAHAGRGLRGAVIYRKLSLGSQSERGERTIERLLSASHTCRLQKRSLFAYLADVIHASPRGDPIPALARAATPERLQVT